MEWLNYHHLLYFWTVAREGTIARASEELRLAQPTISGQIRVLEEQLGAPLFHRTTRSVRLTESGLALLPAAERCLLAAADCVRTGSAGSRSLAPMDVTIDEIAVELFFPSDDASDALLHKAATPTPATAATA